MAALTQGGRALEFAREHNLDYREVLDFSANINPLGPSPKAVEAIKQAIDRVRVYPDENSDRLVRCLAERLRIPAETILVGNGATELLYFWIRTMRPRTANLAIPTFVEYRKALESVGTEIVTGDADAVILTNPNNPSGAYKPPEEMRDWIRTIPPSTQIFVDEAFVEFTAQPSLVRDVERFPNLWVLRSMTKFYALPGLRLGYLAGCGVGKLIDKREPWQVNVLAEAAGIASLQDQNYEEATMQVIQRERIWLWKELQTLKAVHAFPTAANFFLARCENNEMLDRLIRDLAEQRILIRDCRTIEGLNGPYFRFAIRTRAENARLLDHLRKL